MKAMVYACDRCGGRVEFVEEIMGCRRLGRRVDESVRRAAGRWSRFADDETVSDVCPGSTTDEERGRIPRGRVGCVIP